MNRRRCGCCWVATAVGGLAQSLAGAAGALLPTEVARSETAAGLPQAAPVAGSLAGRRWRRHPVNRAGQAYSPCGQVQPYHLRDELHPAYAAGRSVGTHRVSMIKGQGPRQAPPGPPLRAFSPHAEPGRKGCTAPRTSRRGTAAAGNACPGPRETVPRGRPGRPSRTSAMSTRESKRPATNVTGQRTPDTSSGA